MTISGLRPELERALGGRIERVRGLSGGDINEAFELELAGRGRVFVKTNPDADPEMFPAEARGLAWLDEAGALRLPKVIAVSPRFLALEYLEPRSPRAGFDEELGRGLAELHRFGAASFGLDHDNFIGRLPQANAPLARWSDFYRARRLEPQLRRAVESGLVDRALIAAFDRLFSKLDALVGQDEPPARLHGDLWSGNLHVDAAGAPCLIDPAAYGGHREVDLAMMRLFGGFSAQSFAAYRESYPLSPGDDERVDLYQLYPLMVHVNLFGTSYVGSVKRALARYV